MYVALLVVPRLVQPGGLKDQAGATHLPGSVPTWEAASRPAAVADISMELRTFEMHHSIPSLWHFSLKSSSGAPFSMDDLLYTGRNTALTILPVLTVAPKLRSLLLSKKTAPADVVDCNFPRVYTALSVLLVLSYLLEPIVFSA